MPCTVFGFSFALLTSQLLKLCRKLWRPQRCPSGMTTPAFFAAGRKWSAQNTDAQIGTLPLSFIDGKTKFVGLAYGVCLCHSRKKWVNALPIGTSRSEDGVLVLPSTPVFFHDLTILIFRSSQRMSAQRSESTSELRRAVAATTNTRVKCSMFAIRKRRIKS